MILASFLSLLLMGEVTVLEPLRPGTRLEPHHLEGAPDDIDRLIGRELTKSIYPGRRVTMADTKIPDMVERNSVVRMFGRKGPLRIETKGRALGAGTQGDEIMVMNLESRRTVNARIVGPNTVEVDL